jgi:hypothetical protein
MCIVSVISGKLKYLLQNLSPLEVEIAITKYVSFKVLTMVAMKNAIFWDVTLCGCCKNQCSEELILSIAVHFGC